MSLVIEIHPQPLHFLARFVSLIFKILFATSEKQLDITIQGNDTPFAIFLSSNRPTERSGTSVSSKETATLKRLRTIFVAGD